MSKLRIGRRAPDFALEKVDGSGIGQATVNLEDYLDAWLVLLFYPRDFSMI